ncbi:hypothetical protein KFK09_000198 [Dendrobium nobile]|uniref:Uncharacterized protein n=1 Tax=Dendrobium nobile TaxID=94219 RepID=A0A8T3C871_DENNO|nr:hypothetical protein KFK09_000198 [Dendrobium nobile]
MEFVKRLLDLTVLSSLCLLSTYATLSFASCARPLAGPIACELLRHFFVVNGFSNFGRREGGERAKIQRAING